MGSLVISDWVQRWPVAVRQCIYVIGPATSWVYKHPRLMLNRIGVVVEISAFPFYMRMHMDKKVAGLG